MVFDTETSGLDKPFCYDLGYIILNTDSELIELEKHFVIEQIWHNLPLFESAYYKEKRPLYVQLMRQRRAKMNKWGYVMQEMMRDIKKYGITEAYAYNSDFDDKVFTFNCDWFKCINPLENVGIYDIWGYASEYITSKSDYQKFCEDNEYFTDTGNYKGSAEIVYRFIIGDTSFEEKHMGLYDTQIESVILLECVKRGAAYGTEYKVKKILPRVTDHPLTVKIDGQEIYKGTYTKKYIRNGLYSFTT
jgi:hypothetical protein